MPKDLNLKTKKVILGILMLVVLYIAYALSFKKAILAFALNSQLKDVEAGGGESFLVSAQLEHEHNFYLAVLKGYKVQSDDREGRLWQSVSGMAIATGTSISFTPEDVKTLTDTLAVDISVHFDRFTFSGEYRNLVRLLDTLSRSKGIGKIASAKLGNEIQFSGEKEKLVLKLKMAALVK